MPGGATEVAVRGRRSCEALRTLAGAGGRLTIQMLQESARRAARTPGGVSVLLRSGSAAPTTREK